MDCGRSTNSYASDNPICHGAGQTTIQPESRTEKTDFFRKCSGLFGSHLIERGSSCGGVGRTRKRFPVNPPARYFLDARTSPAALVPGGGAGNCSRFWEAGCGSKWAAGRAGGGRGGFEMQIMPFTRKPAYQEINKKLCKVNSYSL